MSPTDEGPALNFQEFSVETRIQEGDEDSEEIPLTFLQVHSQFTFTCLILGGTRAERILGKICASSEIFK